MWDKKTVGYCRVSTQDKKGFGLEIQKKEIKKFAKDRNLKVDKIYFDEAISGIKESRKALDILMNMCREGKLKAIIFPATDRTARSVRLAENLYNELVKNNVRLYFTDMPFYKSENPHHVMMRQFKEVVAEGERNATIERLRKGRETRIRKGRPAGGNISYGYFRQDKQVKINNEESKIIKIIYKQSRIGHKCQKIADYLNAKGYRRRNGKLWTQQRILRILNREELYKNGNFKYGKTKGMNKNLIIIKENL